MHRTWAWWAMRKGPLMAGQETEKMVARDSTLLTTYGFDFLNEINISLWSYPGSYPARCLDTPSRRQWTNSSTAASKPSALTILDVSEPRSHVPAKRTKPRHGKRGRIVDAQATLRQPPPWVPAAFTDHAAPARHGSAAWMRRTAGSTGSRRGKRIDYQAWYGKCVSDDYLWVGSPVSGGSA